jgi:ribulose-5-phosphate 4-epimerase/fuculose-1-phosphate aldolase
MEIGMSAIAAIDEQEGTADAEERELRVQLAAAYRLAEHFGWTIGLYGHLTVRVPGPETHFLINPFGLRYDEVNASNLVKIDCEGTIVEPSDYPVNDAGFVIHSAIHMVDTDNTCVMHTHTRAGIAVSATTEGLQTISQEATAFHGHVSYHDYEGISLRLDERERLVKDLGENRQMILRNHGLLTTGRSIPEAFQRLWLLQLACENQVDAGLAGTLQVISDDVAEVGYDDFNFDDPIRDDIGQLEFAAWIRMLDKLDPSYRN